MKENLLAQGHGLGWSPSSELRTHVYGTLFLWEEFSGRMEKRDGRGLRETREEIEAQVLYLQFWKRWTLMGIMVEGRRQLLA